MPTITEITQPPGFAHADQFGHFVGAIGIIDRQQLYQLLMLLIYHSHANAELLRPLHWFQWHSLFRLALKQTRLKTNFYDLRIKMCSRQRSNMIKHLFFRPGSAVRTVRS